MPMVKAITIFTPTYNRGYTLDKLYESLLRQTCQDFVWLVVDDGSTDNTEELVRGWQNEHKIEIKYYKQKNQGKSAAHNRGAELTETELFFCVDSDDYLTDDAVEQILHVWKTRPDGCIGVLGYRMHTDGTSITKIGDKTIARATFRELHKKGLRGDTALIFKTGTLQKYRFPQFEGEKFITEGYLYNLMDREGEMLLLRKAICVCEYLPDGYSANVAKVLYNNPCGYFAAIDQSLKLDESFKDRFNDSIRYIAMGLAHRKPRLIGNAVYPGIALLAYPGGWLFYCIRYSRLRKEDNKKRRMDERL